MILKVFVFGILMVSVSDSTVSQEEKIPQTLALRAGAVAPWDGILVRLEFIQVLNDFFEVTEKVINGQTETIKKLEKERNDCLDIKKGYKL